MTFVAHGLVGAASLVAIKNLRGSQRALPWILAGFVLGTAPDTFDWILAVLGILPRWELYGLFHAGWLGWATAWIPPIGLHFAVDLIAHSGPPGWSWWPVYWWVEILCWILPIGYVTLDLIAKGFTDGRKSKIRTFILNLALKLSGIPYIWGGSTPAGGFDCSGYVIWILQTFDLLPSGDWTASGLRDRFHDAAEPKPGDLVFYGPSSDAITHVMMHAGETSTLGTIVIGASGGDSHCTTIEEARKRGAQVKIKRLDYRGDRRAIVNIFAPRS